MIRALGHWFLVKIWAGNWQMGIRTPSGPLSNGIPTIKPTLALTNPSPSDYPFGTNLCVKCRAEYVACKMLMIN